ncbi:MAG: hypothetical protein H8D32_05130 [Dehalococcoidia bacterium]|nr:hypothetical protein [Dehalococcoidia bacterium]
MKDFGGAGLGLGFLDDIFGELFRGGEFSFKIFGSGFGPTGGTFDTRTGINLDEILRQAQKPQRQDVRYEITITKSQAARGLEKELVRRGKKVKVKIPAGIRSGMKVRLRNARQVTDGQPGDILIEVKVK